MTRFCSIFNQLLQLFPRVDFQRAVSATKAERHARGFTCWGQSSRCCSANWVGRTRCARPAAAWRVAKASSRILGITAPKRSSLSYANEHRPWELYQAVFYQPLERCQAVAGSKKFRFKNKLLSLDTTVIDLCADVFEWRRFAGGRAR